MGLAASQARFLAITSRKMNCEFQSMQLAQQKLSVTRDLQKASQDYQYALDASKLVWEDENGDTYNLSYDLMMTPSALNEYDPYLLTDAKGRIVLSDAMFNAAVNAGVVDKEGNPIGTYECGNANSKKDGSRNAFLYQLGVNNAASAGVVKSIVDIGANGYRKAAGVGGAIYDKSVAKVMDTNTFINQYLKTETVSPDSDELKFSICTTELASLFCKTKDTLGEAYCISDNFTASDSGKFQIRNSSGDLLSYDTVKTLTLGDLISGQYTLTILDASCGIGIMNVFNTILKPLYDPAGSSTDYASRNDLLVTDQDSYNAALQAKGWFDLNCKGVSTHTTLGDAYLAKISAKAATGINSIMQLVSQARPGGVGGTGISCKSISLSNMLKSYLTYYAACLDGFGSKLYVSSTVDKSTYVTDDMSYTYIINNKNAQTMTELDMLQADFYNMLYNNLCMYGACTDQTMREQVTDNDYLNYALKNGQLFISSLNTDGYFYQGHYTANGHVGEVTDEDAVARAELEYNNIKSKLNYKEEKLELEMKNLDMEIASLSTEYDTVKNLISKGIEKVFTMFST